MFEIEVVLRADRCNFGNKTVFKFFSNLHYLPNWWNFGNKFFFFKLELPTKLMSFWEQSCFKFSFLFSKLHYLQNWWNYGNKVFFIFQTCITHLTDGILGTKLFSNFFFELALPFKLVEFWEHSFFFKLALPTELM